MKFHTLFSDRFILKILTKELVTETYLAWFKPENDSGFIEYTRNQNITLDSLKIFVEEKFNSKDCLFFGIFDLKDNKHIGNIKFEPVNFQLGYAVLGVLIGAPEWRGKGVFAEVFKALSAELKSLGISKIYLGVSKENVAAVAAYKKSGFIIDAENFFKIKSEKNLSMVKYL